MKKILFFMLSMALLCACSKNEPTITETGEVEVVCYQASVTPLEGPRKAPMQGNVKKIVYIILNSEGEVAYTSEQNDNDENFGTLNANVAVGDYTLLIYASASTTDVVVNDDATITVTKCGDAFRHMSTFSVSRNNRTSINAELNRCVAKICAESVENIPSNVANFQIIVTGNSSVYDLVQNKGVNTTAYYSSQVSATAGTMDNGKFGANMFILLPEEETTVSLTFNFYSSSNIVLYSRTFDDVPVKMNCQTNFSAALFHEHGVDGTNVTINTTWGEPISAEY